MTALHQRNSEDAEGFRPLPRPETAGGKPRLTGVEVEFAGLNEDRVAALLARELGGEAAPSGAYEWTVRDTGIGDITVELDISLRKSSDRKLVQGGLDLARGLIPVEIVSAPLEPAQVARLDTAMPTLREAGAKGSGQGLFYGFGVHLNPEIVSPDDPHTALTIRAYALLEEWLRIDAMIDGTRRLLPFVDRWPFELIDDLTETPEADLHAIMGLYARHTHSRNHGLDLLPLFRHLDDRRFAALFGEGSGGVISARPTFHFRLPDSRIDEAGWSLDDAWSQWCLVEEVAGDRDLLECLSEAWREHRATWFHTRNDWGHRVGAILNAQGRNA